MAPNGKARVLLERGLYDIPYYLIEQCRGYCCESLPRHFPHYELMTSLWTSGLAFQGRPVQSACPLDQRLDRPFACILKLMISADVDRDRFGRPRGGPLPGLDSRRGGTGFAAA